MYEQLLSYKPGDKVGHFAAGSELVLVSWNWLLNIIDFNLFSQIFEAPPDLKFCVKKGQMIHYGNRLLSDDPESLDDSAEVIVSSKFDDFNPYRVLDSK